MRTAPSTEKPPAAHIALSPLPQRRPQSAAHEARQASATHFRSDDGEGRPIDVVAG
jgi:hypothetical protein